MRDQCFVLAKNYIYLQVKQRIYYIRCLQNLKNNTGVRDSAS